MLFITLGQRLDIEIGGGWDAGKEALGLAAACQLPAKLGTVRRATVYEECMRDKVNPPQSGWDEASGHWVLPVLEPATLGGLP